MTPIVPHRVSQKKGGSRPFRCLRPLLFRGRVQKGPARFCDAPGKAGRMAPFRACHAEGVNTFLWAGKKGVGVTCIEASEPHKCFDARKKPEG